MTASTTPPGNLYDYCKELVPELCDRYARPPNEDYKRRRIIMSLAQSSDCLGASLLPKDPIFDEYQDLGMDAVRDAVFERTTGLQEGDQLTTPKVKDALIASRKHWLEVLRPAIDQAHKLRKDSIRALREAHRARPVEFSASLERLREIKKQHTNLDEECQRLTHKLDATAGAEKDVFSVVEGKREEARRRKWRAAPVGTPLAAEIASIE